LGLIRPLADKSFNRYAPFKSFNSPSLFQAFQPFNRCAPFKSLNSRSWFQPFQTFQMFQ
jgi:hypothetical protein